MRVLAFIVLHLKKRFAVDSKPFTVFMLLAGFTTSLCWMTAVLASNNVRDARVGISFQDITKTDDLLIAVGAAGTVYLSNGARDEWRSVTVDPVASLLAVTTCPGGQLVALDFYGALWISDDRGVSWGKEKFPEYGMVPLALDCGVDGRVWVAGTELTLLTFDISAGKWTRLLSKDDLNLTAMQIVGKSIIVAGEFGFFIRSDDGGVTWKEMPEVPGEFYPYDVWFENADVGWLLGRGGVILKTTNGGETWMEEENFAGVPAYRFVTAPSSERLFAVGETGLVIERIGLTGWHPASARAVGGFLRGGVYLKEEGVIVVVGGGGEVTPIFIEVQERAPRMDAQSRVDHAGSAEPFELRAADKQ